MYPADEAARDGNLEALKQIRTNGGKWTSNAADWAAMNGHLETLQWIRANGGEWTYSAANSAAKNGHLETLQWIRANGGEWTRWAANGAAWNGHLETLRWILASDGPTTGVMRSEVIQWREGDHPIQRAASTIVEVLYQWNPEAPSEDRFPPHIPELVASYIRI